MSELQGLRNLIADTATLHGIAHEPLFTIRYYDRLGFYAETEWIVDTAPLWHATTVA